MGWGGLGQEDSCTWLAFRPCSARKIDAREVFHALDSLARITAPRIDRGRRILHDGPVAIKPGARLLFIGDSVTDCGRLRPFGMGPLDALGQGYVAEVDKLLREEHPKRPIRITNMGVSGNTVRDLSKRWDEDVLELKPEWLAVMIGVNDVWRQFDWVNRSGAVMPDDFELTYEMLLRRTRPNLKGLVLMTPFYVETDRTDLMRQKVRKSNFTNRPGFATLYL